MPGPLCVAIRPRLDHYRDAWDSLGARQPVPSPFQRSWWLEGVGRNTTYVLVVDGDRLVGGLALRERRVAGVLRYAAPGPAVLCPDHLDLVAAPGSEEAVASVVGEWFARPGQRVLDLRGVADDSLLARALGVVPERLDVAPYQSLPAPPETFLTGRSANFRRSVRRAAKSLASKGIEHRCVSPADLPDAFEAFGSLHEDREGRGPLLAQMPALTRAVTDGVAAGEARVDVLAAGSDVVAVSLAFVVAGRLSLYQVARSLDRAHDGAGNVLLVAVIEDAVTGGCHEVDLLRGGEGYKSSFADATRVVGRLRAAQGGGARAQVAAEDAARRVSARLRSQVP